VSLREKEEVKMKESMEFGYLYPSSLFVFSSACFSLNAK
jgi:hypothetical protein